MSENESRSRETGKDRNKQKPGWQRVAKNKAARHEVKECEQDSVPKNIAPTVIVLRPASMQRPRRPPGAAYMARRASKSAPHTPTAIALRSV
jgi:hypothetical protein